MGSTNIMTRSDKLMKEASYHFDLGSKLMKKALLLLNPDCKTSEEVSAKFSIEYQKKAPASHYSLQNIATMHWTEVKAKNLKVIDEGHCFVTETGECIDWNGGDAYEAQTWLLKKSKENKLKELTTLNEVIKNCTISGLIVKLPKAQLSKELYTQVKTTLNKAEGFWKGGKVQGFEFKSDPTLVLKKLCDGEKINIKKQFQAFFTSPKLADQLVKLAEIEKEDIILEPSAGEGAIIEAIYRKLGDDFLLDYVDYFELNKEYSRVIEAKYNTSGKIRAMQVGTNFMTSTLIHTQYDKIIANPPFSKNQDIDHIRMMYEYLLPGGRIVSVASIHWKHGNEQKCRAFRDWLDMLHAKIIDVPAGAFKESGTNIVTCIIVINKPL
jgi:phospholipid N-methyltransferase